MVQASDKVVNVTDDTSVSDSMSGGSDDKTIPFLRRLRSMLQENSGVITFIPGHRRNGDAVLGRLVVHDRIQVEATVLPRYFNHSSFASLRRQLNYFSFIRLGKGRQRESTYINESVIELDDILTLRRRSTCAGGEQGTHTPDDRHQEHHEKTNNQRSVKTNCHPKKNYVDSIVPVVHLPSQACLTKLNIAKRAKRAKHPKRKPVFLPPTTAPFVSEDEESQGKTQKQLVLDLTLPRHDPEVLQGCTALLGLSGKVWG
eukprot:scaffold7349_cov173-Amphora_coffeaeformis.AAC.59